MSGKRIHVSGRVYDSHGPVPGVAVSNGEHLAAADRDGAYTLEVDPDSHRFVFVTVPDGFTAPDGFYRRADGAGAAGVRSRTLDFTLSAHGPRARAARIAVIADLHVNDLPSGTKSGADLALQLWRLSNACRPDMVAAAGDLTNWGNGAQLTALHGVLSQNLIPVGPLFGGHDGKEEQYEGRSELEFAALKKKRLTEPEEERAILERTRPISVTENYQRFFGPPWYSVDCGELHLVFYPNQRGFFSEADWARKEAWLWRDLEHHADRPSLLIMHMQPSGSFLRALQKHNVAGVVHGHLHASKVYRLGRTTVMSVPPFLAGGIDTSARGYGLVQSVAGGVKMRVRHFADTAPAVGTPDELRLGEKRWKLLWERRFPFGFHRACAVGYDGRLFVSVADEREPGRSGVLCLDARIGSTLWHLQTDSAIRNRVRIVHPSSAALQTGEYPLVAAASVSGSLYILDSLTGTTMGVDVLDGHPDRWVYGTPAHADGVVYYGGKAGYAAYSVRELRRQWYAAFQGGADTHGAFASAFAHGSNLIVPLPRVGYAALRRADGAVAWHNDLRIGESMAAGVVVGNELLTCAGLDTGWCRTSLRTGERISELPAPAACPTSRLVAADNVYIGTRGEGLIRVEATTAAVVWRFETGPDLSDFIHGARGDRTVLADPLCVSGVLVVCGCDGVLYALNRETGAELASHRFGSPISATPVVVDDLLFVGTYDGRLAAYENSA